MNINTRIGILETELKELKETIQIQEQEKSKPPHSYIFILKNRCRTKGFLNKMYIGTGSSNVSPADAFTKMMENKERLTAFRNCCYWNRLQNPNYIPAVFFYGAENSSFSSGSLPDYIIENILG